MSDIRIERATAADAKAIAAIYQDRPPTNFNRLTHGQVDTAVFHDGLEDMFAASLRGPNEVLLVARDEDDSVVSYINLARKDGMVPMTTEVRLSTCTLLNHRYV